ncbi:Uncharacterized protein TCAP_00894 [Tolypocladium capitatum]|uniref:6-phosphogluconolactonase n=1 Tax=Tolypocladium capitatum TaxID=45235 RepID=A0A2K3QNT0_9HYPO|nr:Uncharacterized protein TCAP_00894 [Tolypocladium capitatum]
MTISTSQDPAQSVSLPISEMGGGIVTSIVTSPVDVLRSRLQSDLYPSPSRLLVSNSTAVLPSPLGNPVRHVFETLDAIGSIRRTEGWRGLFRGLGPSLAGVVPAAAVKFYVYASGGMVSGMHGRRAHSTCAGGCCCRHRNGNCDNPIWLVKTRLQLDKAETNSATAQRQYRGSLDCIRQVLQTEGIAGFYRGLSASYLGTVETVIHLVLYERLKTSFRGLVRPGATATWRDELASWASTSGAAGCAKMAAVLVTYPHEVRQPAAVVVSHELMPALGRKDAVASDAGRERESRICQSCAVLPVDMDARRLARLLRRPHSASGAINSVGHGTLGVYESVPRIAGVPRGRRACIRAAGCTSGTSHVGNTFTSTSMPRPAVISVVLRRGPPFGQSLSPDAPEAGRGWRARLEDVDAKNGPCAQGRNMSRPESGATAPVLPPCRDDHKRRHVRPVRHSAGATPLAGPETASLTWSFSLYYPSTALRRSSRTHPPPQIRQHARLVPALDRRARLGRRAARLVVTTLDLNTGAPSAAAGVPTLKALSSANGCAGSPSFLTLDHGRSTLYCVDEGLQSGGGSLSSFKTNADGSLTQLFKVNTPAGPVFSTVYGPGNSGLAVAHFAGSAFTTWDVSNPSKIAAVQTETFKLTKPPANPARQSAPHPHEAVPDPTGKFIVVPDLGADVIRLFAVSGTADLKVKPLPPVAVAPGSGPRHVAFAVKGSRTFMYLVTELGNTIVGFSVTYPAGGIKLDQLFTIGSHGNGKPVPKTAFASEIVISPDQNFAVVSSRGENNFNIPNLDAGNKTAIPSDPIINFSIDATTGALNPIQEVPAGGSFPRQFSMNKAGTLIAVGLQNDGRVVLIKRDPKSGKLGEFAGHANVAGQITSVIFDE